MTSCKKWFLHVDLDAFFASVEQMDFPEYKGKPVIVGGKPGDRRSVVSTASYEARKYGVHSAMPIATAYKLCPQGIYLHGRMERYSELSYKIMNILKEYSPDFEQISIDEAFIDLTGTENLFGSPEQTAIKIKQRIKEEIGLTISAGLAPSKYLAKIASDMNKPDGIYIIHAGQEQDFMLSLPLKKVWGIGKKTLECLNKEGFYTTKDIYQKELITLEFLFGKNTANFLYNVVRGIDTGNFDREIKSHSISNEITFSYDLKDTYTIETKILELCQQIFFRLMKEKAYSQTIYVKIRYEDFSTVSIQKTYNNTIFTLDSFFSYTKKLFEEKYDQTKGVRLIGIAFKNITKEKPSYQPELFNNDNLEKKIKVEEAIFKLNKKHPEIKINKARILEDTSKKLKSIFIFLLISIFTLKNPINASEQNKDFTSLFKWEINKNNNIDFLFSGYWNSSIDGNISSYFGYNNPFSLNFSVPIFKNEIELSGKAQINKNWFLQIDFLDNYSENTYTLGYKNSKFLQEFLVSNRGIIFPDFYSSEYSSGSIGGGNNISPGISAYFTDYKNNKWNSNFVLRYDLTKTNQATFYGKNAVSDVTLDPHEYLQGKSFVIPIGDNLLKIKDIFIEDTNGKFEDVHNRKYRKLQNNEYMVISSQNLLVFSISAKSTTQNNKLPSILITFSDSSIIQNLENFIGKYNDNSSFLGKLNDFFNTKFSEQEDFYKKKIDLNDYSIDFTNRINNCEALQIQDGNGFSPFSCNGIYDFGIINKADFSIISESTNTTSKNYSATNYNSSPLFFQNNFFSKNHLYALVQNENFQVNDFTSPEYRFPFADTNPEIYLTKETTSDLKVVARSYSPVSAYYIGKDVAKQTIKVFINGIIDYNAKYDFETGNVTLSKTVSEIDKIFITWQESSSDFSLGAICTGLGFQYVFTPQIKVDTAITARIPFTPQIKYAQYDTNYSSFVALSSGIEYTNQHLSLSDKLSILLENNNATDIYLADTQLFDTNKTYYHSINSGFITKTIPFINKINLLNENNCTEKNHIGITDSQILGYSIPLHYDFSNFYQPNTENQNDYVWASVDIKLSKGDLLLNSDALELALKTDNLDDNYKIFVQLGINAQEDFTGENKEKIPCWEITASDNSKIIQKFDSSIKQWQIVKILLSDSDRARLLSDNDLRIIILKKKQDIIKDEKGTLYIGPYEPQLKGPQTIVSDKVYTTNNVIFDSTSPSAKKYMNNDNFSSQISWNYTQDPILKNDYTISTGNFFQSSDFSHYKNINFDFAFSNLKSKVLNNQNQDLSNISSFTFILDGNTESLFTSNKQAIYLEIFSLYEIISQNSDSTSIKWHTLTINLEEQKLYIDNIPLHKDSYKLIINKNILPSKKLIKFSTKISDNEYLEKGSIHIGNLYYSNTSSYLHASNTLNTNFNYEKTILAIKNVEILKNAKIQLNSKQELINNKSNNNLEKNISSDLLSSIDILGLKLEGEISTSVNNNSDSFLQAARHSISSKEYFNMITISEQFNFNNSDEQIQKSNEIKIDLSKVFLPINLKLTNYSYSDFIIKNKDTIGQLNISIPLKKSIIKFTTDVLLQEKLYKYDFNNKDFNSQHSLSTNYFKNYAEMTKYQYNSGSPNATSRKTQFDSLFSFTSFSEKFVPQFNFKINSEYSNNQTMNFIDNESFTMTLPIAVHKNIFSFAYTKLSGGNNNKEFGGNFESDLQNLFNLQKQREYFYKTFPIFDLFQKDLSKELKSSSDISNFYSSQYNFIWKRHLFNNLNDLFIPSSFQLQFSRDIQSSGKENDIYQIKATTNLLAMNLFGLNSKLKKFNWYNHDEFNSSFSFIIQIPNNINSDLIYSINSVTSIWLIISQNNNIQTNLIFTLNNEKDWNGSASIIWVHTGKTSILQELLRFISKDLFTSTGNIARKEIFNISISNEDKVSNQIYELIHNCDINISEYTTINSGLSLNLTNSNKIGMNLGLNYFMGIKIEF